MPVFILLFVAVFGIGGWLVRDRTRCHCQRAAPAAIAPAHSSWADQCRDRLAAAARDFEREAVLGCAPGSAAIVTLPSGVEYVEYDLVAPDGSTFQVHVTEEPQNEGEPTGWRGAPGLRVRHENGRLGMVNVSGPEASRFGRLIQPAADFCIEEAE